MITTSPRSWRRVLVAGVMALTVISCSASGGDDTADPAATTTAGGDEASTTTSGDGPVPTTEDAEPTEVTVADLEALLPTAADVGQGYRVKTDEGGDDSDKEVEAALAEACPGIEEAFVNVGAKEDNAATVSMEDGNTRLFEVKLNASPNISPETLDEQIATVNGCDPFTYDAGGGSDITMKMAAGRSDDFGEAEVNFTLELTIENDDLPAPVRVRFTSRTFLVGSVSATVTVSDGIDDATFETIPGDTDLVDQYSYEMQNRLTDLLAS